MSRSYKKTWGFKDSSKFGKRCANKKVRQLKNETLECVKGNLFKKAYESWDISDWRFHVFTKKEQLDIIKETKENLKSGKKIFYTPFWQWRNK